MNVAGKKESGNVDSHDGKLLVKGKLPAEGFSKDELSR